MLRVQLSFQIYLNFINEAMIDTDIYGGWKVSHVQ